MVEGAETYYQELIGVTDEGSTLFGGGGTEEGGSEEGGSEEGGSEEGGSEEWGSAEGGSEEGGSEEGGGRLYYYARLYLTTVKFYVVHTTASSILSRVTSPHGLHRYCNWHGKRGVKPDL